MSDLAEFLDDRCARFVRDAQYRVALVRERFHEEAVTHTARRAADAKRRRRNAAYKNHKKPSVLPGVSSQKEAS